MNTSGHVPIGRFDDEPNQELSPSCLRGNHNWKIDSQEDSTQIVFISYNCIDCEQSFVVDVCWKKGKWLFPIPEHHPKDKLPLEHLSTYLQIK